MDKKTEDTKQTLKLALLALGVVFGDIGTSPLYAIHECFGPEYGLKPTPENVLGILSLVFWSLILVVTLKYLFIILKADNHGEGGIMALMALANEASNKKGKNRAWILVLGLFGAALLYGDGMITPAISVLSAIEGLKIATSVFDPYVVPITIGILTGLFLVQHKGTGGIGIVFGPIAGLWFVVLGILGIRGIWQNPVVLSAVNPVYAIRFFIINRISGFLVLGSVFLVVTGGEALYADMGHFGRKPIRIAWLTLVLPALLLNYFGQGAIILSNPAALENPFYKLVPSGLLYPMVVLASTATIIASQAVISGAFSLTRQAIQLGFSPRMKIEHTSSKHIGQIYIPQINWLLMLSTIALVLGFKSSSNLAAAYGVAVTMTMVITSLLFYIVLTDGWGWSKPRAIALITLFLIVDVSFFGANIIKITHGAWFPLAIATGAYIIMSTWREGRQQLAKAFRAKIRPIDKFLAEIEEKPPLRVPGTAVFMTGNPGGTPPALIENLKHNKVIHHRVILLTVKTEEIPRVAPQNRAVVHELGQGFYQVYLYYGFAEDPDVPYVLSKMEEIIEDPDDISYFLGREVLFPKKRSGMPRWKEQLFAFLSRNALEATTFFKIPGHRTIEIGSHIEL